MGRVFWPLFILKGQSKQCTDKNRYVKCCEDGGYPPFYRPKLTVPIERSPFVPTPQHLPLVVKNLRIEVLFHLDDDAEFGCVEVSVGYRVAPTTTLRLSIQPLPRPR